MVQFIKIRFHQELAAEGMASVFVYVCCYLGHQEYLKASHLPSMEWEVPKGARNFT